MKPWSKRWQDEDEKPDAKKGGSYPPDVARLRRKYALPVTPQEHAEYLNRLLRPEPEKDA